MKIKYSKKRHLFPLTTSDVGFDLNCNELCNNFPLLLGIETEILINLKGVSIFKMDYHCH